MSFKKILMVFVAVTFMCVPAFAGDQPEFDTVGDDSLNFFNDKIKDMVIGCNLSTGTNPVAINIFSDFTECFDCDNGDPAWEYFEQTAGSLYDDPCFSRISVCPDDPNGCRCPPDECTEEPYQSALTDWWNSGEYEWQIVLQKKPQTDIRLNIVDCVLKHNSFDPFGDSPYAGAEQTGRYTLPWGEPVFVPGANPRVTVEAHPGCYATGGTYTPFYLDARTMPGLEDVPLVNALYTSIGVWQDGIVMVMPETGKINKSCQDMYRLKQGDRILVKVAVPGNNSVDIRYGEDNVILEYVAVHGTEFMNTDPCCCD